MQPVGRNGGAAGGRRGRGWKMAQEKKSRKMPLKNDILALLLVN